MIPADSSTVLNETPKIYSSQIAADKEEAVQRRQIAS